jgi:hypothetical protein
VGIRRHDISVSERNFSLLGQTLREFNARMNETSIYWKGTRAANEAAESTLLGALGVKESHAVAK